MHAFKIKDGRDSSHSLRNIGLRLSFQLPDIQNVLSLDAEDTEINKTQSLHYKSSLSSGEFNV